MQVNLKYIDQEYFSDIDFNILFEKEEINNCPVKVEALGKLELASGCIVVCDPINLSNTRAIKPKISAGIYPVKASRIIHNLFGPRYGALKIEFNEERATKWFAAVVFEVDSGQACICDAKTRNAYKKELKKGSVLPEFLFNPGVLSGEVQDRITKFISVPSGLGDWTYICYWGVKDDGTICSFLMDFSELLI